ncbi:response regulator [Deinococcus sp. QL22]|uniref:response regulator n=1 Tax=Deinococcus sp. QL22 TaxID=2939437 RepID=UPI0020182ECA|nr:response regulator [Deinococcus sp. QL22]UQN08672.1 response regulator [Deinococcus sp. QL22]
MKADPVRLMLVEDNPADVFLIQTALELSDVAIQLSVAWNGQDALEQLWKLPEEQQPNLILLDLNMPRMNGFELLAAVRADPALAHLAVVMLTTSNAAADVERAYALQVNSYISKPANLEEFLQLIELLKVYWFKAVSLPVTYVP